MHGKSRMPNFDSKEWKRVQQDRIACHAFDTDTRHVTDVGEYEMYINTRDSCIGLKLTYLNKKIICLFWEKKITVDGKEKKLSYAAYWSERQWVIRRIKSLVPKVYLKKENNAAVITVSLSLITNKEETFSIRFES